MNPISAKTVQRATAALLSIETLRGQCELVPIETDSDGVETHPDDTMLLGFLSAAVAHAEKFTGRAIDLRTFEFALDTFPRTCGRAGAFGPGIEVPYPPLVSVESFTYGDDSDGVLEQDVDYLVDTYGDKAVLRPLNSWPSIVTAAPNRVVCRYRAGYMSEVDPDSDAEPLPGDIRAAILLIVAHLYENRSATVDKAMAELPLGVESMLRPSRVLTGMA